MRNASFPRSRRTHAGFSLLEIIVVVMILTLLAGLLIPVARDLMISSKVDRMLATIDAARGACQRFHQDTDQFAKDDTGQPASPSSTDPKQLTSEGSTSIPGYKGPYLRRAFTTADNPFGGRVAVWNDLTITPYGGFDVLGDTYLVKGAGNLILFEKISLEVAAALDLKIDPMVVNLASETFGRCVYKIDSSSETNGVTVYVFLAAE